MPYEHHLSDPVVIRLRYAALVEAEMATAQRTAGTVRYSVDLEARTLTFPVQECVLADLLEFLRKAKVGMFPEDTVIVRTFGQRGESANFNVTYGHGPREIP